MPDRAEAIQTEDVSPFPGRWLGGASLVLAPLLLLSGILLRLPYYFFFPQQLAALLERPQLIAGAYNLFLAGILALWPAIVTLAGLIGRTRPGWAAWGGSFVLFGLFARTFHAGADFMAFQVVRTSGVEVAIRTVAGSYGKFHVVSALNATILIGWLLLAIGAYLSGTLGRIRSISLALMAALMMGVVKGSSATSVVAATGLCVALVPLGVAVLRTPPTPSLGQMLAGTSLAAGLVGLLFYTGQLG